MKKIVISALFAGLVFSVQAEGDAATAEQDMAATAETSFSGFYMGGGIHFMSYQDAVDYIAPGYKADMDNSTKSRLGGTIVLGVGKKMESIPFYMALEAMLDFAPNTDNTMKDKTDAGGNMVYSVKVRRNGLMPSVGLRFAWANESLQALAYLKIAASFTKDKLRYVEHAYNGGNPVRTSATELRNSKVSPELTLGIEKRFGKMGMRAEAGWNFGGGKKKCYTTPGDGEIQLEKKGSVIARVMGVWHVKAF